MELNAHIIKLLPPICSMIQELQQKIIQEVLAIQNQEALQTVFDVMRTVRPSSSFILNDAQKGQFPSLKGRFKTERPFRRRN